MNLSLCMYIYVYTCILCSSYTLQLVGFTVNPMSTTMSTTTYVSPLWPISTGRQAFGSPLLNDHNTGWGPIVS